MTNVTIRRFYTRDAHTLDLVQLDVYAGYVERSRYEFGIIGSPTRHATLESAMLGTTYERVGPVTTNLVERA